MKINVKCPVCKAGNQLTTGQKNCRRCKEDLSMLYNIKGYSFYYRLYYAQLLIHNNEKSLQQQMLTQARWLKNEKP